MNPQLQQQLPRSPHQGKDEGLWLDPGAKTIKDAFFIRKSMGLAVSTGKGKNKQHMLLCWYGIDPSGTKTKVRTTMFVDAQIDVLCAVSELDADHTVTTCWHVSVQTPTDLKRMRLAPENLSTNKSLSEWLASAGIAADVNDIERWAFLRYILQHPGAQRTIGSMTFTGIIPELGVVIGATKCLDAQGNVVSPENGLVQLVTKDGEVVTMSLPKRKGIQAPNISDIETAPPIHEARITLEDMMGALRGNIGHHGGALGIGWTVANLFYPEVMEQERRFPNFYLYGRSRSGKNVLAQILADISCMGHHRGISAESRVVSIRNQWSNTCGWPLWINEFTNTKQKNDQLLTMIRNGFDGEGMTRGDKDGGTEEFPPRRGIMMTGEELFGTDSERSRYVCVTLSSLTRNDAELPRVRGLTEQSRLAFLSLVRDRAKLVDGFMTFKQHFIRELTLHGVDQRQAFCWGVCLAGIAIATRHEATLPDDAIESSMRGEIIKMLSEYTKYRRAHSVLAGFWESVRYLHQTGKINSTMWFKKVRYKTLAGDFRPAYGFNFPHLIQAIKAHSHHDDDISSSYRSRVLTNLQEEKWYIGAVRGQSIGDRVTSVLAIDPELAQDSDSFPWWMEELADNHMPISHDVEADDKERLNLASTSLTALVKEAEAAKKEPTVSQAL